MLQVVAQGMVELEIVFQVEEEVVGVGDRSFEDAPAGVVDP